ncbi:serine hydrolase domain-containing protein [Teichococcus cervicalis]|uniref:Beta-lactamase n=1 Tax=Pseudoroseomonas cervicalis ATCC 49957 TaxID=525371 RepID=D5RMS6_9PROT|nr:serine hydrolase domain-containing protein [Pseudoroseomonas cervicalis]EFH11390.1 beta-lactamase [Pseudoroseomonas cervicalis ATCC 49957]
MSATDTLTRTPDWVAARDAAERLLAPWREGGAAPGGAILAFDASRIRVEVAAGLESLSGTTPFSGASVVRYASVTKHVLAALALRDGPSLDDALGAHLPELRGGLAGVSLGRALDMTGGLPDLRETLALLGLTATEAIGSDAALGFLARQEGLNFSPGTQISYSNTGYRLVEAILARRGHRFADFVEHSVNRPLGLAWRAPELWSEPVPGLVPGYWQDGAGWQQGFAGLHLSASGCLTGSGADLARWGQALLRNEGAAEGLLARQGAPRHLADGRATGYGLGLAHDEIGGVALIGHGGSHIGYKTYLLLAPEPGLGVVLVANREDAASHAMALATMAALLGAELPPLAPALPPGLYAEDEGPHWLEIAGQTALFLGAGDTLHAAGDGSVVTLSAHLPMRLRATAEGIEGELGHVARRFRRVDVAQDAGLDSIQGEWRGAAGDAAFRIEGDTLLRGIGPARRQATLRPLGGGRYVTQLPDGPWPLRFGLAFAGDEVALTSHRSRVLRFHRAG